MSFKATAWVYKIRGITLIERAVLAYLAFRQNSDTGLCIVSVDSIKEDCEIGRSTIFKAIQSLRAKGFLKNTRRFNKNWQLASKFILNTDVHSPIETPPSTLETPQSTMWTPLESGSESGSKSSEATDQTVLAILEAGNSITDSSKINKFMGIEVVVHGHALTPQMVAAGVTGVVFQSQAELEEYGPELGVKVEYVADIVLPALAVLGVPVNVDDILQLHQKNLTVEQAILKAKNGKKSYTSLGLKVLWQDLNIVHNPGVFQKPLTMKEQGQLGYLAKSLATLDIGPIMASVLADWIGFGKFLKDQGLVWDFPDKPSIGFFLKHGGMAFEFSKKLGSSVSVGLKPFDPDE